MCVIVLSEWRAKRRDWSRQNARHHLPPAGRNEGAPEAIGRIAERVIANLRR